MAADDIRAEQFALTSSPYFSGWLGGSGSSLAFTTYQAGKLFMVGVKANGDLSIFERTFPRSMGLAVSDDGRTLALAVKNQIHRFDNVMQPGQSSSAGYDAIYAPHAAWVTGDLDAHDIGFSANGRPVFANTLFSCIAEVSDGHSFKPLWMPPFVSQLAAEDRCHLNGLAMEGHEPRYATAVSRSDVAVGWRDRRVSGGVLVDVRSSEIVAEGFSMPHSPRLREGRLWLLNSGAGEFGFIDPGTGHFEVVAFCPGYARGLAFIGDHAIIGLSLAREDRTFSGLPLEQALQARDAEPRCGLAVIDLNRGEMVHWVRIEGIVRELYDVAVLPGVKYPSLIGFKSEEVCRIISIEY